jgi:hypothetical protein
MDPRPKLVALHLDLKYQMPRKNYLLEWVQRLPEWGVNALLIEYEDKLPFGKYPFLRAEEAFTPGELRRFLDTARGVGLKVIPLIQSLAHLEFALAHPELEDLRERRDVPCTICPSNPRAIRFVHDLFDEALRYHAPDEFFHIGADEASMIGLCPACRRRIKDADAFYREHDVRMCRRVMQRGKRPILWDDAFGWGRDPETVAALPKEAIPASWEYFATRAQPGKYPWMNLPVYRKLGYEHLGTPCLNYQVLFPMPVGVENTRLWAQQVRRHDMFGMIQSQWACFHMPLPMTACQVAATGALMRDPTLRITPGWEDAFFREEFGADVRGLSRGLRALGERWEIAVEGLQRPINPVYCYMDMMLWYPRGHEDRRRNGAYPLDWREVDFVSIHKKKARLLAFHAERERVVREVGEYEERYDEARRATADLARRATRHRREAELYAAAAELKWLYTREWTLLLRGKGNARRLLEDFRANRRRFLSALTPFLEPGSVRRMDRLYCEPPVRLLEERR